MLPTIERISFGHGRVGSWTGCIALRPESDGWGLRRRSNSNYSVQHLFLIVTAIQSLTFPYTKGRVVLGKVVVLSENILLQSQEEWIEIPKGKMNFRTQPQCVLNHQAVANQYQHK